MLDRFSNLPVNGYWDVFDPLLEAEKEPVWNSLADDLADIYQDIKEDLVLFDAGQVEEAVWQWRFHFLIHWGKHLTTELDLGGVAVNPVANCPDSLLHH